MDRPAWWRLRAAALLLGVLCPGAPVRAGQACAASPPPVARLTIAPGAMPQRADDRIRIEVHADGCVAVWRPWFLRQSGWHAQRLDPAAWDALQNALDTGRLGRLSQTALDAELAAGAAKARAAASSSGVEIHALDRDVHVLGWRDGGRWRELVVEDPLGAAEDQPKAGGMAAVASAVRALQSLAVLPGSSRTGGGTP